MLIRVTTKHKPSLGNVNGYHKFTLWVLCIPVFSRKDYV